MTKTCFVTGAAGFIGSALVRQLLANDDVQVIGYDALTYSGKLENLAEITDDPRFHFIQGDICDASQVAHALERRTPDWLFHLAAESHVDRSIDSAGAFVTTNVLGTQVMLDCARTICMPKPGFRFIHISTDEVFGDLAPDEAPFTEASPYKPSSPYAASKAGSDHLVRAAFRTHGLPVLISNCSNNYGPRQLPEKLIPLMISNAMNKRSLPIYGDGQNRRDWLHVDDHARALVAIAQNGRVGETYCVGGGEELSNLDVVTQICTHVAAATMCNKADVDALIKYVPDRPGHDRRYSVNASKISAELGWKPMHSFGNGLKETVDWYLGNPAWVEAVAGSAKSEQRLGLGLKS